MFDKKTANRVTLASVDEKLGTFMYTVTKQLDEITASLNGNGKPGIKTRLALMEGRMDDEEKINENRRVNLLAIWSAIGAIITGITVKLIVG